MTLNGHFALTCVSDLVFYGLAFCILDKTVLKFADLCIMLSAEKISIGALVSDDVNSTGIP